MPPLVLVVMSVPLLKVLVGVLLLAPVASAVGLRASSPPVSSGAQAPKPCWQWREPSGPWGNNWSDNTLAGFAAKTANETRWAELPPRSEEHAHRSQFPKLAILFFTHHRIDNPMIWSAWMEQARHDGLNVSFHVYASVRERGGEFKQELFLPFLVNETASTSWGNIAEAEMLLMRRALMDAEVTHLATVSYDTVPLKPLSFIYSELKREPSTRMCVDLKSWEEPRGAHAETWWLMNRGDAQLFRDNWELVQANFEQTFTEEKTWLFPLLLRKTRWRNRQPLLDECVMFTDWADSCNSWADHSQLCNCPSLLAEPHQLATGAEPRIFKHAGPEAWKELLRSPFWWGRKFADNALKVGVDKDIFGQGLVI